MPRFFSDQIPSEGSDLVLNEKESRHALEVLRLKTGDSAEILDGKGGSYSATIGTANAGKLSVRILSRNQSMSPSPVEVSVAMSVIRPERMELFIQKACELGASEIIPLVTERSIVRLSAERWAGKIERWEKIIRESCKQCGLPRVPDLRQVTPYDEFIRNCQYYDLSVIPTLSEKSRSLGGVLSVSKPKRILVLIGPEGDFTPKEIAAAESAGAQPVSLGPFVLRSETAGLYALSVVHFFYRESRIVV